ncbi:MAG: rod shape-determining protein RodA, partial [Bacillati bacterium ANGP1]
MSRRLLRYLDWPVLVATLILVVGGAVVLYSAVQNSGDASTLVRARILHAVMGLLV